MWLSFYEAPAPFFAFVDLGHHVYFGNTRGTRQSQKHVTLDPRTDGAFWDYYVGDMVHDVRATVGKIMEHSGSTEKGYYVGYSQGTA